MCTTSHRFYHVCTPICHCSQQTHVALLDMLACVRQLLHTWELVYTCIHFSHRPPHVQSITTYCSCGRFCEPHSQSLERSCGRFCGPHCWLHAELCQAPVSLPEARHDQVAGAAAHRPPHQPLPCLYRPLVSSILSTYLPATLPVLPLGQFSHSQPAFLLPCLCCPVVSFHSPSLPRVAVNDQLSCTEGVYQQSAPCMHGRRVSPQPWLGLLCHWWV